MTLCKLALGAYLRRPQLSQLANMPGCSHTNPCRPSSPADVKIVAEAHRAEMEAARSGTPNPQQAAGATPPIPIAPGGGPLSAPGSLGAPTPPAPASPAHSHASAAAAALGAVGGPARSISGAPAASEASGGGASDDDFPLDVEEPAQAKATIGALGAGWLAGWGCPGLCGL